MALATQVISFLFFENKLRFLSYQKGVIIDDLLNVNNLVFSPKTISYPLCSFSMQDQARTLSLAEKLSVFQISAPQQGNVFSCLQILLSLGNMTSIQSVFLETPTYAI